MIGDYDSDCCKINVEIIITELEMTFTAYLSIGGKPKYKLM